MLIQYSVENLLSFNKKIDFTLIASKYKRHSNHIKNIRNDYRILKTSSIYGANAAGKTNLLRSIRILQKIVITTRSSRDEIIHLPKYKLCTYSPTKPVNFEIEFFHKERIFRYELSVNDSVIEKEVLYKLNNAGTRFEVIFSRKSNYKETTELIISSVHEKDKKANIRSEIYQEDLFPNQSFLNYGDNRNIKEISIAFEWFSYKLLVLDANSTSRLLNKIMFDMEEIDNNFIHELLKLADTGISKLKLLKKSPEEYLGEISESKHNNIIGSINKYGVSRHKLDSGKKIDILQSKKGELIATELKAVHICKDTMKEVDFDLYEESMGTNRFLDLIPAIFLCAHGDTTLLIDELESSLHPILALKILNYFFEKGDDKVGQIIFTTHESTLLDLDYFRQDEIWFAEKEESGESSIYSLVDFKPRFDKNIKKSYLQGRFGAIPFLGDINALKDI